MAKNETTAHDIGFDEATQEEIDRFNMDAHLVNLLLHEPFFSTFIRNMTKVKSYAVPTAGVAVDDLNVMFFWNPKFLASLKPAEIKELLKHECYHVIFKHCTSRKQDPPMVWNIATDLAINSILDHRNLPEGGLIPGKPLKTDKIKDKKTKERWLKLSEFIENAPLGKSSEWYMEKMKSDEELMEAAKKCIEDMSGEGEGIPIMMDDHEGWGDLTEEERQILEGKVKEMLKKATQKADATNGWGSIPGSVRDQLRKMSENSVNWKRILQSFIGRRQRMNKARTHKKVNRKYPYVHPGIKRDHTSTLAIYIDQSGSVNDYDLELFFGALSELAKSVTFMVYPFDYTVDEENAFMWKKRKKINPIRTRSGGTCFEAVEKHFRKVESRFDGYLVLTDGCAPKPSPAKKKRCWVLLPDNKLYFKADNADLVVEMERPATQS